MYFYLFKILKIIVNIAVCLNLDIILNYVIVVTKSGLSNTLTVKKKEK